jgi:hypothetical protein
MAAEEATLLADAAKLPLEDRVAHANWKVRAAAYDAIRSGCASIFDEGDPVLSEYGARADSMRARMAHACTCCCWLLWPPSLLTIKHPH